MKVAGADVWKGKWVVVTLDDGVFNDAFVASTIEDALQRVVDVAIVAVDMPIGLPDAGKVRSADEQARVYVWPRWHSVFLTPSRDLLEAQSHKHTNELARSEGRDGITIQAYGLGARIFQVEPVAARDSRLYEVHPEVSFATANDNTPLQWSKTSWNGINQRRRILQSHGITIPDDLGSAGGAGFADVLDAGISAWSANRIANGSAERIPGPGLPGARWRWHSVLSPAQAPGGSRTRRDPHLQLESRLPPLPRGALAGSSAEPYEERASQWLDVSHPALLGAFLR